MYVAHSTHNLRVTDSPLSQTASWWSLGKLLPFPCLPQGTLNSCAVCDHMPWRSCKDRKEPERPSKSQGVQKRDNTQLVGSTLPYKIMLKLTRCSWTLVDAFSLSISSVPEINEGVTRLWLKINIYVFIKDCMDPKRCSKNNNKHHLTWRKNMLPSNKQKLICFRTIEWVGKAQWNNRKLCLISVSHICPWYKKKMSLYTRVTIEWPIVALRSILASKTSHTKRFLSSKWECLNMNSKSN